MADPLTRGKRAAVLADLLTAPAPRTKSAGLWAASGHSSDQDAARIGRWFLHRCRRILGGIPQPMPCNARFGMPGNTRDEPRDGGPTWISGPAIYDLEGQPDQPNCVQCKIFAPSF